jgi:hypothetical protein
MGIRSRSRKQKLRQRQNNATRRQPTTTEFRAKKISCAPKKYEELNMFSCYTDDSLNKLKNAWNAQNPGDKILSTEGDEIHKQLSAKLKNVCQTEACWVEKLLANNKQLAAAINDSSFAPDQPNTWDENPNEWLSSDEITHVMKQYENAYKDFKFLGPSPIDFDKKVSKYTCVWDALCKFSVADYLKHNKNKIGFIFNTDPHTKGGKHWISMFLNLKKGEIFFFDSVGNTAPKQIKTFVKRVIKQGKKLGITFKYDENYPVEHQYGDTECGIYSLFFIVHMLQDRINKEYLKTHIIKDKDMETFREKYFNKNGRRKGGSTLKHVRFSLNNVSRKRSARRRKS